MTHYTVLCRGQRFEVSIRRQGSTIEAEVSGRKYTLDVEATGPGFYSVLWGLRSIEASVSRSGEEYSITWGTHRIAVEVLDVRKALQQSAHHGQDGAMEVRAAMPGKIVRLLVERGAEVAFNQGLVVMEAMKMQNEIRSPKQGRVRTINVSEGETVAAGDLVAIVE